MKKLLYGIATLAILMSCTENKIAFVDNAKLMNDYQEKIDIENKYKVRFEGFDKKRDSVGRAFQTEAMAFQNAAAKMNQNTAQEKYNELMLKKQNIGQLLQDEEQSLLQQSQTEVDTLKSKVRKFVKEYGKKNGYTFILGSTENGSVLYGDDAKDITADVVKALNDAYGVKE